MRNCARNLALLSLAAMLALGLLALVWATTTGSSEAQQGAMQNCPQAGKWAISVWDGADGTAADQAFATCGDGAVIAAYDLDPQSQGWSRWFAGRPEITTLSTLDNTQGVIALGGAEALTTPVPSMPNPASVYCVESGYELRIVDTDGQVGICIFPDGTQCEEWSFFEGKCGQTWAVEASSSQSQDATMHNCPQPGKWAISVWDGDDGTDAEQAFATCGQGAVAVAYSIDPDTQMWSRWFADRPEISNLTVVKNLQGVMTLGAVGGPLSAARIAFVSDRDGNDEIYVMNADGSGQTNLTNNPAEDAPPAWSPDGSQIAFVSDRDGNAEIYVMNADGSGQTNLTNDPALDLDPAWSPDGSQIAFFSRADPSHAYSEIYVMNADGSGRMNLTNNPAARECCPDWSPDGSKIAFIISQSVSMVVTLDDIYVMNADGSGRTNLTRKLGMHMQPRWSPDGSKIAFGALSEGACAVSVMSVDGTVLTCVGGGPLYDTSPVWSPDGSKIAFVSVRDGDLDISVMSADGSGQTNLTNSPGPDLRPVWSPDGSRIAFVSERDGNDEIYVMSADGSGQTRLTDNAAEDDAPVWAP